MSKERKIKAAVCYDTSKPLVMEEVILEPPGKGEVMIRNAATSICHSDLHMIKGEHGPCTMPAVAGHETCGWVEEVGEGVTYVKPGDLVIYTLIPEPCDNCYYCHTGEFNQCINHPIVTRAPGRLRTKDGKRIYQWYGTMATFAEYATGSEYSLVKIPKDMPVDKAALISCGVIAGYGAVVNRAKVKPNKSVIVVGCGGVGLNAIQAAKFVGAFPIIGIDTNEKKLEMAKKLGATYTINAKKVKDIQQAALEVNEGRKADYVFACVMGIETLRQCFLMAAKHGTTCVIGHGFGEEMKAWTPVEFCGGKVITGSAMGGIRTRLEIPRIVELYKHGRYKLDELVSGHYKFDQLQEALDSMAAGDVIRNVIMF
jgi:S-(hydroxymethyl)glutathione dehydrogenase / alcohol dehydrogenase